MEAAIGPSERITRTYYYAGAQRLAVRVWESDGATLYYLHSDHLGSTSLATEGQTEPLTVRGYRPLAMLNCTSSTMTSTVAGTSLTPTLTIVTATVTLDPGDVITGSETRYKPYGEVRTASPAVAGLTEWTYTGQGLDAGSGLMYCGARWYEPYLNRWISPDTIIPDLTNPQSFNRYSYVLGNPLRYSDPSGHMQWPGDGGEMYPQRYAVKPWQYEYILTPQEQTHMRELSYRGFAGRLREADDLRATIGGIHDVAKGGRELLEQGAPGPIWGDPRNWRTGARAADGPGILTDLGIVSAINVYEYAWGSKHDVGLLSTKFASVMLVDTTINAGLPLAGAAVGCLAGPGGSVAGAGAGGIAAVLVSTSFRDPAVAWTEQRVVVPCSVAANELIDTTAEWYVTHSTVCPDYQYYVPYHGPTNGWTVTR